MWYPLKRMLKQSKSRIIYFESGMGRKKALEAILREQGFSDQLEQYRI